MVHCVKCFTQIQQNYTCLIVMVFVTTYLRVYISNCMGGGMRLSETKLMITDNITILEIFSQPFGYQAL